jgi:hypothetical protein
VLEKGGLHLIAEVGHHWDVAAKLEEDTMVEDCANFSRILTGGFCSTGLMVACSTLSED